ncbi:MAG: hypothetical protein M1426_00405 [Patescibacteria group bacterium]|nr:hypothetical protein [Patescibacteria group bacterium]
MFCSRTDNIRNLLPDRVEIPGWLPGYKSVYKGEDSLSSYLDGGARLYGSYGFKEVGILSSEDGSNGTLTIELYRMEDSRGAFGVYLFNQSGEPVEVGSRGCYNDGLLQFWKGDYYGRIVIMNGLDAPLAMLVSIAQKITGKIADTASIPFIMNCLPKKNLIEKSERYFFHYLPLNNLYYIADFDVLKISNGAEGIYAEYRQTADSTVAKREIVLAGEPSQVANFIMIRYPEPDEAQSAGISFLGAYLKMSDDSSSLLGREKIIMRDAKNNWIGIHQKGQYLLLVLEGRSKEYVLSLIDETVTKLK